MSLLSSAGAGHTLRGKYRVYGEGSVHHSGQPCDHGLDLDRHPVIFRHDWPSIWSWLRAELANEWNHHQMHRWARSGAFSRDREGQSYPMAALPSDWLNDLMVRLFGPPYRRVPTVEAGIRPQDSLYGPDADL